MRSPLALHPRMRLRRQRDFQRAYREGGRARGSILVVVAVENGTGWTRMGLSIGRKIWRGAVQRNRLRRVFREAFRLAYPELPPGLDLVLMSAEPKARPALQATRDELIALVRKAHRRARERATPREREG